MSISWSSLSRVLLKVSFIPPVVCVFFCASCNLATTSQIYNFQITFPNYLAWRCGRSPPVDCQTRALKIFLCDSFQYSEKGTRLGNWVKCHKSGKICPTAVFLSIVSFRVASGSKVNRTVQNNQLQKIAIFPGPFRQPIINVNYIRCV